MSAPPDTVPTDTPVPLVGICPPEARYSTSIAARIANDTTQCTPIDPCMSDGTTLWMASPCTPTPSPTDPVTTAIVSTSPAVDLPATGPGSLEVALLAVAAALVAIGTGLRSVAANR